MAYIKDSSGNYVPAPIITGADGREVSLQNSGTYIQWRYPDSTWNNLIAIADLMGPTGATGLTGSQGESSSWYSGTSVTGTGTGISAGVTGSKANDLYINTDTGNVYQATAANTWDFKLNIKGADGSNIELQATSSFIQWRSEGGSWVNLVSIASISGVTPTLSVDESGNLYVDYITDVSSILQQKALQRTVEIAVADWSSGTSCTKTVSGVTADNIVLCDPSDGDIECSAQGADELTFTCSETPTEVITVKAVIFP